MNDISILVSVRIPAPVDKVYRAWTEPKLVSKWFAEDSEKYPDGLVMDHRVGGRFRATIRILNESFSVSGEYKEIIENEKIVFRQGWDDNLQLSTLVIVEFREREFGTEMFVTQENIANQDEADGHRRGWEEALARLAQKFTEGEL